MNESTRSLTARQAEVIRLRREHGATLNQIAEWLCISRRAVLYRLQNARRRAGREARMVEQGITHDAGRKAPRRRLYSASQIKMRMNFQPLTMDDL